MGRLLPEPPYTRTVSPRRAIAPPTAALTDDLLVYEGMVAAFQVAEAAVKKALASFGITPAQFGVLRRVGDGEELSLTELAHRLGCSNANVTRLIENMVRAHLLERGSHPFDRRVSPVRLTPQGVQLREQAAQAYSRAVARVVKQLGDDERSVFLALRSRFE